MMPWNLRTLNLHSPGVRWELVLKQSGAERESNNPVGSAPKTSGSRSRVVAGKTPFLTRKVKPGGGISPISHVERPAPGGSLPARDAKLPKAHTDEDMPGEPSSFSTSETTGGSLWNPAFYKVGDLWLAFKTAAEVPEHPLGHKGSKLHGASHSPSAFRFKDRGRCSRSWGADRSGKRDGFTITARYGLLPDLVFPMERRRVPNPESGDGNPRQP